MEGNRRKPTGQEQQIKSGEPIPDGVSSEQVKQILGAPLLREDVVYAAPRRRGNKNLL